MSRVVYNRGRPNKKFGTTRSESLVVANIRIREFFTSFGISSDTKNLIMVDTPSLAKTSPTGNSNISLGINCGTGVQGDNCISIGANVGSVTQGSRAIGIGSNAGCNNQSTDTVSIGTFAGSLCQGAAGVSIGLNAGKSNQSTNSVAIGTEAGATCQQTQSIAIGVNAGTIEQATNSISIGTNAGSNCQGAYCISIGTDTGSIEQKSYSIAIGSNVGSVRLGSNSIVIGRNIKCTQQNTMVINTDGSALFEPSTQGFYMKNIITEKNTGGDFRALRFNPTTSQIVYDFNSGAGAFGTAVSGTLEDPTNLFRQIAVAFEAGTSAVSFEILALSSSGEREEIKFLIDIANDTSPYTPRYYHSYQSSGEIFVISLIITSGLNTINLVLAKGALVTGGTTANCYLAWTIY